ncbi:uncharacterized protein [Ptychodera flava]|uniref:uncharacterized protein n=1 Tax=Ptychodera flava TaxID=63121 RepID=UPI003969F19B
MEFRKFRQSGELSDITVVVDSHQFQLHKFPLYAKSDFFKALVRSAMVDKDLVHLKDFPGGVRVFSLVADFCYNMDIQVSPRNVAQLRCAAEYLQMTSPGNLASQTEEYLQDVLYSSKFTTLVPVVEVFKGCCDLGPIAEQIDITGKCIRTLVDAWKLSNEKDTRTAKDAISNTVLDKLIEIPTCWFQQLLITARDRDVPKSTLAKIAGKHIFSLIQNQLEVPICSESLSFLLDSIFYELPTAVETLQTAVTTDWVIHALKMATETDCKCRSILLELAGKMLRNFSMRELTQLSPDLLMEVVQYACSSVNCIPEVVCEVIDRYLYELALEKTLTPEIFVKVATCLPVDFRANHDLLFQVTGMLFQTGGNMTDAERSRILEVVDFRRLSEETLRRAHDEGQVPITYITKAALALCTKLRAALETAKNTIELQEERFQMMCQCTNFTSGTWIKDDGEDVVDVRPQSRDNLVLQVAHVKESSPVSIEMTHALVESKLAVCALSEITQGDPVIYVFSPFKPQLIEIASTLNGKDECFTINNVYRKLETGQSFWPYTPKRKLSV